jgi:hypothetical protein
MALVVIGAFCVIVGVAMAALRTAGRGRLSQPRAPGRPMTLEPRGEGRRLSVKADLLGLGMAAVGAILIMAGALSRGAP